MLDQLIPTPRLLDIDQIDVAAPPERVWQEVRHGNLARSPLIHALFELRTMPDRLKGHQDSVRLFIDDLRSLPEQPGFQVLSESPPSYFVVGAIGKVWHAQIPFVHVPSCEAFAAFDEPDFVKVAWSIRVSPLGEHDSHVELEVRVDATDDDAWRKFERYFRLIGPASHFIRRALLNDLARELGSPASAERQRALAGDELLPDARAEASDGITIEATPEAIWPWLLQMGCRRAGYYSVDIIDNGGERSSRELVPELQQLRIGQVLPATPEGDDGFEVLQLEPARALVLGGLFDPERGTQLPFGSPRPERFWHVTWAFELERLDEKRTRLHVRARAAFPERGRLHALWLRPAHHFMQRSMLEHLAARVEKRLPRDDFRDVLDGAAGAALMLASLFTPFLRRGRSHWGLSATAAAQPRHGDQLVPEPGWGWTHAVEVEAPAANVWRWVAQVGAGRGGFYSYQWLENLVGCQLENADAVHPEWELEVGDALVLHPKIPPLQIVELERGRYFVAHAPADAAARASGKPWAIVSWLFELEPLAGDRCRVISRQRVACSSDLGTSLSTGPTLLEPVGFAMDRRMLLGIKQRAERQARYALAAEPVSVPHERQQDLGRDQADHRNL